jgi:DNA-binding NarL/FixJ family response regulator
VSDRRYLRPDEANRLIEACGMRWSQVDLDSGTVHIARLRKQGLTICEIAKALGVKGRTVYNYLAAKEGAS